MPNDEIFPNSSDDGIHCTLNWCSVLESTTSVHLLYVFLFRKLVDLAREEVIRHCEVKDASHWAFVRPLELREHQELSLPPMSLNT